MLVQVSPSLVKRQKTHFHDLPCGASVILGNNGFIWIYPTPEHKEEDVGGFVANLEVRKRSAAVAAGRRSILAVLLGQAEPLMTRHGCRGLSLALHRGVFVSFVLSCLSFYLL